MSLVSSTFLLLAVMSGTQALESLTPSLGKPGFKVSPSPNPSLMPQTAQISASGHISTALHKKVTMRAERMQPDQEGESFPPGLSLIQGGDMDETLMMDPPETLMSNDDGGFQKYKAMFGRTYDYGSPEHFMREKVFRSRMQEMIDHNNKGLDWTQGVNQFTDRTDAELQMFLGYRRSANRNAEVAEQASFLDEGAIVNGTSMKPKHDKTKCGKDSCGSGDVCTAAAICKKCPVKGLAQTSKDAVDWSLKIKGAREHIMDQGGCGSCWAIASAGAIEVQIAQLDPTKGGVRVSPEAIMQCSPNPRHCGGDGGCQGSTPELAFAWVEQHPIQTLGEVPYTQRDLGSTKLAWCHKHEQLASKSSSLLQDAVQDRYRISIAGFVHLPVNQEEPLVQALVCSGPVVAAAWASTWFSYRSGILKCPGSGSVTVDHAILMVGFGVTNDQKHYWRIRNSWGSNFGENGFLRLARYPGKEKTRKDEDMQKGVGCKDDPKVGMVAGECGILSDTAYPVGSKVQGTPVVY